LVGETLAVFQTFGTVVSTEMKRTQNYIGQIKVEQNAFTTEALGYGVSLLFFSVAPCFRGSKNV
jgi:hypothetical protein